MRSNSRFIWLDFIRGTCAIIVCAGHLRAVSILDYASIESTSIFQKLFYLVTSLGHQSVMVFFVLSGFFVGGTALKNRTTFDPRRYIVARLTRLWIVLIPALVATSIVDGILSIYAPNVINGFYKPLWSSGPEANNSYSSSIKTFFANLAFLQTITSPVFGTNGPLWSLSNEFWYYVLFPLILLAIQGRTIVGKIKPIFRVFFCFIGFAFLIWLPFHIVEGFFIWCAGLLVYVALGKIPKNLVSTIFTIGAVFFAVSLGYSKSALLQKSLIINSDLFIGAAFCLFAIGITNREYYNKPPIWFSRVAKFLSDISFSLYLFHFPLVMLIGGLFYGENKLSPDAFGLLYFNFWLMLIVGGGYIFYVVFERRTDIVRRFVEKIIFKDYFSPVKHPPTSE